MTNELSSMEIAVLYSAAQGDSQKETAKHLFIAPSTVKSYRQRIIHKLNAKNITNAVWIYYGKALDQARYVGRDLTVELAECREQLAALEGEDR